MEGYSGQFQKELQIVFSICGCINCDNSNAIAMTQL